MLLNWAEASADSASLNKQIKFAVDGFTYFYEYDPVGIVHSDGNIEIYDWCIQSIANNNRYAPRVEGGKIDLSRDIADIGKPGRSPYMPMKVVQKNKIALNIQNIEIENISAKSKSGNNYLSEAGFSYDIRAGYKLNTEALTFNSMATKEKPSLFFDSLFKIAVGAVKNIISTVYTLDIQYEDKDEVYIALDANITMYDKKLTVPQFQNEVIIIDKENPTINFKYDKTQDAFIFSSISGANSGKIIEHTQGFTLKKGETKVFYAIIENVNIGENNGAEASGRIKLIYTLSY